MSHGCVGLTMPTKELFKEISPDYRADNDPWGHAMGAYFAVAEVLHFEFDCTIDSFKPGAASGPDDDSFEYRTIIELQPTRDDLERLAKFLDRLTDRIRRAGKDY